MFLCFQPVPANDMVRLLFLLLLNEVWLSLDRRPTFLKPAQSGIDPWWWLRLWCLFAIVSTAIIAMFLSPWTSHLSIPLRQSLFLREALRYWQRPMNIHEVGLSWLSRFSYLIEFWFCLGVKYWTHFCFSRMMQGIIIDGHWISTFLNNFV